jgi:L-seryl-tRNA(Ser) seleniumtransferase
MTATAVSAVSTAGPFQRLPSVDALLRHDDVAALAGPLARDVVVDVVREEIAAARARLRRGESAPAEIGVLVAGVLRRAAALRQPSLRRVINATGVVLHTNLGRAPLSAAARGAMADAATGYSNLEFDLERGARGSRHTHLEDLICRVTGAEAALAVNNNAAAVLLVLAEIAAGRDVIVSRGQAVEIGGGFRIPDVLRQSGARLVEVGTTNRTRAADYAAAMGPDTAALLHVHASNFRIVGFTESVPIAGLAALGRERNVPVIDDAGSGCLLDTNPFGIGGEVREPTVQESLAAGADLVCFSGDKLLGGPQAGVIAGREALVARLKRHPLTRALRPDKVTIGGLAATLLHYRLGEAAREIPVWRMIGAGGESLDARAREWAARLASRGLDAVARPDQSAIGGGSLPGVTLPTTVVAVHPGRAQTVDQAAAALRRHDPPVVVRIAADRAVVDPRTVLPEDEAPLLDALTRVLGY